MMLTVDFAVKLLEIAVAVGVVSFALTLAQLLAGTKQKEKNIE
jgi:hypothetical protein